MIGPEEPELSTGRDGESQRLLDSLDVHRFLRLVDLGPGADRVFRLDSVGLEVDDDPRIVDGVAIDKATALTSHPVSGDLFAVINSTNGRELATIDPVTGVATIVGALGENFAGLAFVQVP